MEFQKGNLRWEKENYDKEIKEELLRIEVNKTIAIMFQNTYLVSDIDQISLNTSLVNICCESHTSQQKTCLAREIFHCHN